MKNKLISSTGNKLCAARFLALLAFCALFSTQTLAQQTAGGTQIENTASATYSDGSGNTYETVSNTVIVTVARVSGLTITPDAGNIASVVPGQQNVIYPFTVTNTGNFSDQVRFLLGGQSVQLTGSATLSRAVIDVDDSGTINAGDLDILTNMSADVLSASIAQNDSFVVLVEVDMNANAAPASVVNVQLGDAPTVSGSNDNQPSDTSTHEVRTVSNASVNGLREARGDVSVTVDTDAQLQLSLTAPSGPVALGSNISYGWKVCSTGLRDVQSITLPNAPAGSNSGVFILAPIPVGTSLATGQTFPAGTLYSVSALTVTPLNAVYTTTAPSDLSTVRRVAFNVGGTLAVGACSATIPMQVTITTTDASLNIFEIGDTFGTTTSGSTITDQSGDTVSNAGDGNADFDEGNQPGNTDGNGIQQITTLMRSGSVLIGPLDNPAAIGPTSQDDDYTNRSVSIPGIPAGGLTISASSIVFTNTLSNTGNANDTFVLSLQSAPAGFTVEIKLDGGAYTTVTNNTLNLPINFGQTANIMVRVTAPAGSTVLQAGGFPVVIRATSTASPTAYNETIDRFYTGVFRMVKTAVVINGTGVGNPTDPVPGADIVYTISYDNISSTGGTGNSGLTISNIIITEDGNAAPNNWGTTTTHVASPAPSDSQSGTIVLSNSDTKLVDTVPTLAPQASGTFVFRRRIN
jgi:hypothetical protein